MCSAITTITAVTLTAGAGSANAASSDSTNPRASAVITVSPSVQCVTVASTTADVVPRLQTIARIQDPLSRCSQLNKKVNVYSFALKPEEHQPSGTCNFSRIDNAQLSRGKWSLSNAWIKETEETIFYETYSINTNLTIDQIQENFSPPETISFWALPNFITIAEEAGFASQRHKTRFFNLIVFPFFLIAMVLASAPFSINYIRTSRTNILIFGGIFHLLD